MLEPQQPIRGRLSSPLLAPAEAWFGEHQVNPADGRLATCVDLEPKTQVLRFTYLAEANWE